MAECNRNHFNCIPCPFSISKVRFQPERTLSEVYGNKRPRCSIKIRQKHPATGDRGGKSRKCSLILTGKMIGEGWRTVRWRDFSNSLDYKRSLSFLCTANAPGVVTEYPSNDIQMMNRVITTLLRGPADGFTMREFALENIS